MSTPPVPAAAIAPAPTRRQQGRLSDSWGSCAAPNRAEGVRTASLTANRAPATCKALRNTQ
eukprot:6188148-Pleurochrysis_carterae.AAC.1